LFTYVCWLHADKQSIRQAKETAAEAKGANYVGTLIVLVCFLPIGFLLSLDLLKIIRWAKERHNPRPPRR